MSRDLGLLILRVLGLGLAFAHGWSKLSNLASGEGDRFIQGVAAMGFPLPVVFAWAAALSETLGGLCLALGFGTRIAAAFCAFTMAAAAFGRHHAHHHFLSSLGLIQISPEQLEKWGSPEKALVYLAAFLGVLLLGPGRISLDHLRGKAK